MQTRPTLETDAGAIKKLLDAAFKDTYESAMVTEDSGQVIAFAMISHITLENAETTFGGFALGPVAVSPNSQNRGVGSALIEQLIERFEAVFDAPPAYFISGWDLAK